MPDVECKVLPADMKTHQLTLEAFKSRKPEAASDLLFEANKTSVPACEIKNIISADARTSTPLLNKDNIATALAQGVIASLVTKDSSRASELMQELWKNIPKEGPSLYFTKVAEYLYLSMSSDKQSQDLAKKKVPELLAVTLNAVTPTDLEQLGLNQPLEVGISKMIPENFRTIPAYQAVLKKTMAANYKPEAPLVVGNSQLELHHLPQGHLLSDDPSGQQKTQIGLLQLASLRRLEALKPVIILDEGYDRPLSARSKQRVETAFKVIPTALNATATQLEILADLSAGEVYHLRHPKVSYQHSDSPAGVILGNSGMKQQLGYVISLNSDFHSVKNLQDSATLVFRQLDHNFRESVAVSQIGSQLKKQNSGKAVVIFGAAHDFKPIYQSQPLVDSNGKKVSVVMEKPSD
jgi:hypothetical protein